LEKQLEISLLDLIQSTFARFWSNELLGSQPSFSIVLQRDSTLPRLEM
jgi:hypothetical protein